MRQDYIFIAETKTLLSKAELLKVWKEEDAEYISKFKARHRRNTSLAMRNLSRKIISNYTQTPIQDWKIKINQNNKRSLCSNFGIEYCVSYSHSKNWMGIALSTDAIGIDIEETRHRRDWKSMSASFFSNAKPAQSETEFLHQWTSYEANLKFDSASPHSPAKNIHHKIINNNTILCVASNKNTFEFLRDEDIAF
ncbi:4'-phosphopantetheinyl transferase family protein [Sneathiella glossodoripedis]|uniref:4'-phosphopantetheinyl transferase family protein n=1 Tax=Sneathiella glossodoripedis TaxID=418853 RepID=UPI0011DC8B7D|nr:hypothetical protein [Sneathiella glossodoripedis]